MGVMTDATIKSTIDETTGYCTDFIDTCLKRETLDKMIDSTGLIENDSTPGTPPSLFS